MAMTPSSLRTSAATKSHSFTRSRRPKREAYELWPVSCSMATVDSEFIEAPVCCSSLRWARYRLGSMPMPSAGPVRRIRSRRRVGLGRRNRRLGPHSRIHECCRAARSRLRCACRPGLPGSTQRRVTIAPATFPRQVQSTVDPDRCKANQPKEYNRKRPSGQRTRTARNP
jgi:hypothetical protein